VEEYNKAHPTVKPKSSDQYAAGQRDQIMARRAAVVISTVSKPSDLSPRGVAGLVLVVILLGVVIWVLSSSRKPKPEMAEPLIAPRITETAKPAESEARMATPSQPSISIAPTVPSLSVGTEAAPPPSTVTNESPSSGAVPALEVNPDED
jgi:hypothetical protein